MFSLEYIKEMNKEAMKEAIDMQKLPIKVFSFGSVDIEKLRSIHNIGDYRPEGFNLVNTYFVDSSGFGSEGEPALTFKQFSKVVKPECYYAIIECGQFQVYIGEFIKVEA